MISHEQFAEFARQGYNRIPVALELLADLDTPLSVYLKVANQPYSYLFESVHGGERWGRYSIIGLPSRRLLVVTDHSVRIFEGEILQDDIRTQDPLAFIEEYQQQFRVPLIANLPRFTGGLVGYFGYDCVRYVEKKLAAVSKPDPIGMPDILLMLSEEVIVFDNLKESIYLITHADPSEANAYARSLERLEFGLILEDEQLRIYGAGILSGPTETVFSIEGRSPNRIHLNVDRVMRTDYTISDLQATYFVIESFRELFHLTEQRGFEPIYESLAPAFQYAKTAALDTDHIYHRGTQEYELRAGRGSGAKPD